MNAKEFVEFKSEFRSKLLFSIRDDLLRPSMLSPDMVSEESSSFGSSKRCEGWNEVSVLCEPIDNNKNSIISNGVGKFDNEIHRYLLPHF